MKIYPNIKGLLSVAVLFCFVLSCGGCRHAIAALTVSYFCLLEITNGYFSELGGTVCSLASSAHHFDVKLFACYFQSNTIINILNCHKVNFSFARSILYGQAQGTNYLNFLIYPILLCLGSNFVMHAFVFCFIILYYDLITN